MRKKQREITAKNEIEALLQKGRVGRLATIGGDGFPYITPLNYVYWRDNIYFHCALAGEKLDNIRRDPRVCFEIDYPVAYLDTAFDPAMAPCEVTQFFQSIVIRGRAEVIEDVEEKCAALNALMASHENVAEFNKITADNKAVRLCHVVSIRIEQLTAKANLGQAKSDADKERLRAYFHQRNLPGDRDAAKLIR